MHCVGQTAGNGAIVVLIHDDGLEALAALESTVLAALRHFGLPFMLRDTLQDAALAGTSDDTVRHPLVLAPQSGTIGRLSEARSAALYQAVLDGLGLVCYDPEPAAWPGWLRRLFVPRTAAATT